MKSYEILPPGMAASATEPKAYEMLPRGGLGAQGLGGMGNGDDPYAMGVAGAAQGFEGLGKAYEILPPGMAGSAKEPKAYEMLPRSGLGAGVAPIVLGAQGAPGGGVTGRG